MRQRQPASCGVEIATTSTAVSPIATGGVGRGPPGEELGRRAGRGRHSPVRTTALQREHCTRYRGVRAAVSVLTLRRPPVDVPFWPVNPSFSLGTQKSSPTDRRGTATAPVTGVGLRGRFGDSPSGRGVQVPAAYSRKACTSAEHSVVPSLTARRRAAL